LFIRIDKAPDDNYQGLFYALMVRSGKSTIRGHTDRISPKAIPVILRDYRSEPSFGKTAVLLSFNPIQTKNGSVILRDYRIEVKLLKALLCLVFLRIQQKK
jgi:hypothetical protein